MNLIFDRICNKFLSEYTAVFYVGTGNYYNPNNKIRQQMIDWLRQNNIQTNLNNCFIVANDGSVKYGIDQFIFENKEDAVRFKMTWS